MNDIEEKMLNAQQVAETASAVLDESDKCAKTLNIDIESVEPGGATLSMIVKEAYANGHGMCQGGIIATLADTAFAHACNSYNQVTVAQGLSVEFVRPAKVGDKLTAKATEQSRGKRTGVYLIEVRNPEDKLVAIMTGKSFSSDQTLFSN